MGADTAIAWCDDTINVWHGCTKVDALCKHCYAEVSTPVRVGRSQGIEMWGPDAARVETKSWEANLRSYARRAVRDGRRRRVFAQSLSDTFEDRPDLDGMRARFFRAIDDLATVNRFDVHPGESPLELLLLTKRPENILRMVPPSWLTAWPPYVWIGTSVGTRESLKRIGALRAVPAPIRFLSAEPQLEDLGTVDLTGISWVIQGGESGPRARPFDLAWARSMRAACKAAGVPYFLKQLGARPEDNIALRQVHRQPPFVCHDSHGGDESEWPADLRGCRAWPEGRP